MKNLRQIINIVKHIKLKPSDLITFDQSADTKINQFYQKIQNGAFTTEDEAAQFFYGSNVNNSSYKNLKSNLRNRLINTLFFINSTKNQNERENAYLYCSKYSVAGKILFILNIREAGTDLFQKVLRRAIHFDFTEYVIEAAYALRSHYAIRIGNEKKFEYYNEMLNRYHKIREAEFLAGELYLRILIPYIKNKSIKEDTYQQAKDALDKLAPYLTQYDSPYLHYIGFYIESLIYLSKNDYATTVEVCVRAIDFFDQKPYAYNTAIKAFLHQQILCYTQLKQFQEGRQAIEKSNAIVRAGSYNWYVNTDLHETLELHSKNYQEAYYVFNKAVGHKKFSQLNDRIREKWQIYEAYIHFLVFTERVQPIRGDKRFTKFKMGRFLNSVPTFSKDKRGLNIPILVIQIVFMIVKKDYEQAVNRIEAIDKYRSRYLRKDDNFRSNCFIKMLLQIPISGFHKAGIERRAKKYVDMLSSVPLEIARQANEIEIIPYEDLWEIIIDALETRFYRPRG